MGQAAQKAAAAALRELRALVAGEVRCDPLSRALYASDASIYQIVPDGVVLPRSVADVVAAVRICAKHRVPLTARGAGTGLAGAAVNRGIQLDCSRYLNRIRALDPAARRARVEPGVVLDELNARLARYGLHFAPDVATGSRATIGGMIASNSCGAHSLVVGRTVDHVLGLEVVLADGSTVAWGQDAAAHDNALARHCERTLAAVARDYADQIALRYPKLLRHNGGYGLDRLRPANGRINPEAVVCGSEGTLGIIVGATLRLTPLPACKALLVAHFDELLAALAATPAILEHRPAAVELVDRLLLAAARAHPRLAGREAFVQGEPEAVLIVELHEQRQPRLRRRLDGLAADLRTRCGAYAVTPVRDPARQNELWQMRQAGLGLLMSRPGDSKPHAFVEDTAVDPRRLRDYIARFAQLLAEEGVEQAGYYAHASVGCLHVRPVLNLKRSEDVRRLRRIAERVSALALEFGGTTTAEHGDGLARSEWLARMYGPKIIAAFRQVKAAFDPQGLFNPGKIVDPLPMDANLRYRPARRPPAAPTMLDFRPYGGMAGLAEMCSGLGACRQRLLGTMCPSYMATGDEIHTTRARANALRIALAGEGPLAGLGDPALARVFDLCLSCKACKSECPTGTDVARLKAEWLWQRNRRRGVPRRSRLIAGSLRLAGWGSRLVPLSNWLLRSPALRLLLEKTCGLDRRIPPPRYARPTFRQWFRRHRRTSWPPPDDGRRAVIYFVDTWTNCFTPQVGIAALRVLEALGREVFVPPTACCGRPLISHGLLARARALAQRNVAVLDAAARRGIPILASEPSCLSALSDELPQLVRSAAARRVAAAARSVTQFVARALAQRPDCLRVVRPAGPLLYHGHCHEKALFGTEAALRLLSACAGGQAAEINSGCCGMAGSFGHEREHYELARAIGEQRLFAALRARGEAQIAISGFSCREHIAHHTGVAARHVLEYVAGAIAPGGQE